MKLRGRILILTGTFVLTLLGIGYRGSVAREKLTEERLALLTAISHDQFLALSAQAEFKTQVQEWKNVLLRGSNPENYERYYRQFLSSEQRTRILLEELVREHAADSAVAASARTFLESHAQLRVQYEAGLVRFATSDRRNPFEVDKMVRGIDREPTQQFEEILRLLETERKASLASIEQRHHRANEALLVYLILAIIVAFGCLIGLLQLWVTTPVLDAIAMAKRIANDDFSEPITVTTDSEVGELQRNLNRMESHLRKSRTELLQTHENLILTRDRAIAASAAKSNFLANMSHELRTPLNGVIGMTSLLIETPLEEEQQEIATTILASGTTLLKLINDVLDFSKIEAERITLERVDFDLHDLLEETITIMAHRVEKKDLSLGFVIDSDVPVFACGDPMRLQQILTNLVSNAVKFTTEGEVSIRVRAVAVTDGLIHLEFAVVDTGIGIKPEKLEIIFDAFTQEDESTTRRYGGTGLGLAISRKLVALMGGTIRAECPPEGGSIFTFSARLERATEQFAPPANRESALSIRPKPGESPDILLVDDHAIGREMIAEQLKPWGWTITEARNGREALALIAARRQSPTKHPFRLILCDHQMPEVSGLDVAKTLGASHPLTHFALMVSMDQAVALKNGTGPWVDSTMGKPITRHSLYRLLSRRSHAPASEPPPIKPETSLPADPAGDRYRHCRVLVAEDNAVNQLVVAKMLTRLGLPHDIVADGNAAAERCAQLHYDLVLMDLSMPTLDGYAATRRIHAQVEPATRPPIIIALTANALESDRRKCLQAGMNDYLSKPITLENLTVVVEKYLKGAPLPQRLGV